MQLTLPQLKQQPPSQALYISINSWDVLIIVIYGFAQVIILMLMQIWLLYNTNQEVRMITSIYVKCEACDLQGGSSEAALPLWIPLLLLLHNSSPSPSTAHYFGDKSPCFLSNSDLRHGIAISLIAKSWHSAILCFAAYFLSFCFNLFIYFRFSQGCWLLLRAKGIPANCSF